MRKIRSTIGIGALSAIIAVAALTGCKTTNSKSADQRTATRVFDDNKITNDIRSRLKKEPIYKFDSVDVTTVAGVVQLRGQVTHPEQQRRAEEISRNTLGVKEVLNGLVLRPDATLIGAENTEKIFCEPPRGLNASQQNQ